MILPSVAPLGRVVPPTAVPPIDLSRTFAVGQSLLGTIVRIVPYGGVLVNFNGQQALLPLGQQLVPGQTLAATVVQVSPTLMLQLMDESALSVPAEVTLTFSQVPQEEAQGVLTASQLKEYLTASQPFGQTVTILGELLTTSPLLHDIAPGLTQALQDTLTVLQPQGDEPPDATQLQEQVDRSGINYESKVQRVLTGASSNTAAELAKDLKGQLLELSHRLEQLAHTSTDTRSSAATAVLEQVKRAVQVLELQQLANQFALQGHQPLVLPLVHPFTSPTQTTHLVIHRDGGKEGRPSAQQERYTVALSLDLTALGPLHIEAIVHGSEVSATLQVEDPVVAEFLRAATPELCAQLQALGLQAHVSCDVQEHVARDETEPTPRSHESHETGRSQDMTPNPAEPRRTAVALKYDAATDSAPKVIAKGRGLVAEKIMALAREQGIPMREDPDLVQLLTQIDLAQEIPPTLYKVVAEVLAFVYRLNQRYERSDSA